MAAYAESYLNDAINNLGEAFDYAINACHIDIECFMEMFISSGYATQYARGFPKVIVGWSGTELVMEIIQKSGLDMSFPEPQVEYDYSAEYWCGWILGYYQWHTGMSFQEIMKYISVSEILKMYPTLHEAAEEKFVDIVNARITKRSIS